MTKKIAVVGAGAAGLMAALDLRDAGYEVVVLEARDRVGGRIRTVHFEDGRFGNAGAEWLNSSDTLALSLVGRYGLDLTDRYGFEAIVNDGLPVLDESGYPGIDEAFASAVARVTNLDEPWNDPVARELDKISLAEWTFATRADERTIRRFFQDNEGEFMAPAANVSMAAVVLSAALTNNDRAHRLTDGTAALPEAMAADLGDSVHLAQAVIALEQGADGVTIHTEQDFTLIADAVILTAPLPAVERIDQVPDLALPHIAQGQGGKLMVPYDNSELGRAAQADPGTAMKFVYANASHQAGGGVILTAYSDQALDTGGVLSTFAHWFPHLAQSSVSPIAAWWSEEPYSGTTYSAPQPGYLDALRELREPHSRVILAGEHTEILFGYVESALVSGRRAARLVTAIG